MPTTIEILSAFLRDGHAIRNRLRTEYFRLRRQPGFHVGEFLHPFNAEVQAWTQDTARILERGFNSPVPSVSFTTAPVSPVREAETNVQWGNLVAYLDAKLGALVGIIRDADPRSLVPLTDPKGVFLVHGRSDEWNTAVGSYLAGLGFSVIALEDQPNLGKTLIEKFEANAEVGTAVVLFTSDDVGCLKDDLERGGLVPRARQNVLIELGFFFGRLGRDHVCLLKEPGVEIPSDLSGIVYTQIDLRANSDWQGQLIRELTAMGLRA